jgi:hypothetical protein
MKLEIKINLNFHLNFLDKINFSKLVHNIQYIDNKTHSIDPVPKSKKSALMLTTKVFNLNI